MANQEQDTDNELPENSAKRVKRVKAETAVPKDESSVAFYLNSSLFVFFVTSWMFAKFLDSNGYPLVLNDELLPEAVAVFGGLFVFSFLCLFLLSFSRFVSRVFLSVVAGVAAAYLLGLYSSYNIGEYLASSLDFLPRRQLHALASGGNFAVGIIAGIAFFILVNILRGGAMALLSLPALCALFVIFNNSAAEKIPNVKENKASIAANRDDAKSENVVYLVLSDHAGYAYALEKWQPKSVGNPSADKSPYFINDFYQANNFTFFPHAYSLFQDKYRSVASVVNPSQDKIGNEMFSRGTSSYYTASDEARVTLSKNETFKKLKDSGYKLNVYQSYPINYCDGAEGKRIDRCVTYPAPMGALYNADLSLFSKVLLLTGHWMDSFPPGRSFIDYVRKKLLAHKIKVNDFPFVGNPYARSLSVGQEQMLLRLRDDVKNAKGKNVFFAHVSLPGEPYVYDRFCRLKKDPQLWRLNKAYEGVEEPKEEERRWDAYNQQLFCTYAQINAVLKDWEASGDLKHTKIIIHGDKGASIMPSAKDLLLTAKVDQALERVKRNSSTIFAVYSPNAKKGEVKPNPCDLGTLAKLYLFGEKSEACKLPDLKNFGEEEKSKLQKWLTSPIAGINYTPKEKYAKTYADWLDMGGQSSLAAAERRYKAMKGRKTANDKLNFLEPPAERKSAGTLKIQGEDSAKQEVVVPVPEEQTPSAEQTATLPEMPGETVPAVTDDDTQEIPEPQAESVDVIFEQTPSEAPKKIELPEIDPEFAKSKWKLVEEADAKPEEKEQPLPQDEAENKQPATNEVVPLPQETVPASVSEENKTTAEDGNAAGGAVALPDLGAHPVPEAAPVPEAQVSELPPLSENSPTQEQILSVKEAETSAQPKAQEFSVQQNVPEVGEGVIDLPDLPLPEENAEPEQNANVQPQEKTAAANAGDQTANAAQIPASEIPPEPQPSLEIRSESFEADFDFPEPEIEPQQEAVSVTEQADEAVPGTTQQTAPAPAQSSDVAQTESVPLPAPQQTANEEIEELLEEDVTLGMPSLNLGDEATSKDVKATISEAVTATDAVQEQKTLQSEQEPAVTKPADQKSAEQKPAELKPTETTPETVAQTVQETSGQESEKSNAPTKATAPAPVAEKASQSPTAEAKTETLPAAQTQKQDESLKQAPVASTQPAAQKADPQTVKAPEKAKEKAKDVSAQKTATAQEKAQEPQKKQDASTKQPVSSSGLVNKDDLDITREIVTERISPVTGQKETYIFIERKRNPNRFRKRFPVQKELKDDSLSRSLPQKVLDEEEQKTKLTKEARPQVPEKTLSTETANPDSIKQTKQEKTVAPSKPATPKPASQPIQGRELESGGLEHISSETKAPIPQGRVL